MMIGRTDERDIPCHPTALCETADVLRARSRNPSGPRSSRPHRKAGHMTALVPVVDSAALPLNPKGRPHMDTVLAGILAVPFDLAVEIRDRERLGELHAAVALDPCDDVVGR